MGRHSRRRLLQGSLALASLGLLSGCGIVPPWAQQSAKVPRIGFLGNDPAVVAPLMEAFRQGLRERGWAEGQNITIEYRYAEGSADRLRELAAELVRLEVELIFAPNSAQAEAARQATSAIPIVFAVNSDPVGTGQIASLASPGGNITGLAQLPGLAAKMPELLKEAVPRVARAAVLWDPATPSNRPAVTAIEAATRALGVQLQEVAVRSAAEFNDAFSAMAQEGAEALLVVTANVFFAQQRPLADLAMKQRLPTMFAAREFAEAGGLMSYAANFADLFRRAATYVDKILKGARPADLPVEQADRFDFVINLRTAQALGLTIPPSVLLQATELIQ